MEKEVEEEKGTVEVVTYKYMEVVEMEMVGVVTCKYKVEVVKVMGVVETCKHMVFRIRCAADKLCSLFRGGLCR